MINREKELERQVEELTKRIEAIEQADAIANTRGKYKELFKKPKHDPLANLFDGCLIRECWEYTAVSPPMTQCAITTYDSKKKYEKIRLLDIDESPRNTWLCATPELLKQCYGMFVLLWLRKGDIYQYNDFQASSYRHLEDVIKFMIIED